MKSKNKIAAVAEAVAASNGGLFLFVFQGALPKVILLDTAWVMNEGMNDNEQTVESLKFAMENG